MRLIKNIVKKGLHTLGYDVVKINHHPERVIYQAYFRSGCLRCIKGDPLCEEILTGLGWDEQLPEILKMLDEQFQTGDIVEVGANIGASIVPLINQHPKFHLHCFEPVPIFHTLLKQNIASYKANKVTVINKAVGNAHGAKLEIAVGLGTAGASGTDGKFETVQVEMTTLDQYAEDKRPCLIKIDVDGHEMKVLEGAKAMLVKHRPWLFMEFDLKIMAKMGESAEDYIKFLKQHHYTNARVWDNFGQHVDETKNLDSIPATVARLPHYANILFIPARN